MKHVNDFYVNSLGLCKFRLFFSCGCCQKHELLFIIYVMIDDLQTVFDRSKSEIYFLKTKNLISSFLFISFKINVHYNGVRPNLLTDSKFAPFFINNFIISSLNSSTHTEKEQANKTCRFELFNIRQKII